MKLLLDTNFLLIPGLLKIDIFSMITAWNPKAALYIVDRTQQELRNIMEKQRGRNEDAARLALQLVEDRNIHIIKTESLKNVDEIILDILNRDDFVVATQDRELKAKLKAKKAKILILRQKQYVELV